MAKVIKLIPNYSFEKRIKLFISIFGGLWLIIEPLNTFGLAEETLKDFGVKGYFLLLLGSLSISIWVEFIHVKAKIRGNDVIYIFVTLKSIGKRCKIYTYSHLRIEEFLNQFRDFVQKGNSDYEKLEFLFKHYKPNLYKVSTIENIQLDLSKSFAELEVSNGEEFEIEGEIVYRSYKFFLPPIPATGKFERVFNNFWSSFIYGNFSIFSYMVKTLKTR